MDGRSSDFPSLQDVLPGSTTQAVCDELSKDRSNILTVVMLLMLADFVLHLHIDFVLFFVFFVFLVYRMHELFTKFPQNAFLHEGDANNTYSHIHPSTIPLI